MASMSTNTGYQPYLALPHVSSPIAVEKRRGAFSEALTKSNPSSPTKPTPAKKSKPDADGYLDEFFVVDSDARGDGVVEYESGKSDQADPAGVVGLKDDQRLSSPSTSVSANEGVRSSSSAGMVRTTTGKGRGNNASSSRSYASHDAIGGASSDANAIDANISSSSGGALSSPSTSKTQYFRIDSENLSLRCRWRRHCPTRA